MCLLWLRSTTNKDGKIQEDDRPTSCEDRSKDLKVQRFSNIEENKKYEKTADTSFTKISSSIRKKLEAAINLDRSLNEDTIEDKDFSDLRAAFKPVNDNLEIQGLQNGMKNLEEEHLILEQEKCEIKDEKKAETSIFKNESSIMKKLNARLLIRDLVHDFMLLPSMYVGKKLYRGHDLDEVKYTPPARPPTGCILLPSMYVGKKLYRGPDLDEVKYTPPARPPTGCILLPSMWSDLDLFKYTPPTPCTRPLTGSDLDLFKYTPPTPCTWPLTAEEHCWQMILMMLLFLLKKNRSGNIKYRQTSCRKYPCLNSILYLLWKSGDVEANPGPPANSTLYRRWLYDVCSVVRKATVGVSPYCKMKNIWQQPPDNWPSEQPYFDPHNSNKSVNEVETFLYTLIKCCDKLRIHVLSEEILSEIDTWNSNKSRDNCQLLNMYISRVYCRSIGKNVNLLISHLLVGEVLTLEVDTGVQVTLSRKSATDQQFSTRKMYRSEATRKIAAFQCKILHGKDPEKKCDDIWTKKPDWWPSNRRYYNPNNGGKRFVENEDTMLVQTMITRCEQKQKPIILQKPYQDMVDAWRANDQRLLSKLMTRHTAETELKRAVMKLHEEGLLQDSEVDKQLRELGLLVQCESKAQKRKMANTINKHDTKRTKQRDNEGAVDTTPNELFPDRFLGELLRKNSQDDPLPDMIREYLPDSLNGAFDDIQC